MDEQPEYYVVPVIPVDALIHNEGGFCDDVRHEYHEHAQSINDLDQAIQEGLVTAKDATCIFRGQTV